MFNFNWCWFGNVMQSIIWGWHFKKINNDMLFPPFLYNFILQLPIPHKHMILRSRCNNNSLNDWYHHVLSHCNESVYLGRSKSSACPHPLPLLTLLPCECDGRCTQVPTSQPALRGSLGAVTLNASQIEREVWHLPHPCKCAL